jgi:hypothetical protein
MGALEWVMGGIALFVVYDLRREDHMLREQMGRRMVEEVEMLGRMPFLT